MSLLHDLNSQQQQAVTTVEGPLMVVAGPGSGKTRVLTYRIAHLISIGVPAYHILALTFTNKAANEMKGRIVSLVGERSRQLWMGTFHSVCARILRVEAEKIGYRRNYTIYDEADTLALVKAIMSSLEISLQQYNPYAVRSRISGAKNQLMAPREYAEQAFERFEQKAAAVYEAYQQRMKTSNAMDFDDLLLRSIELFRTHPGVLQKYQEYFRFILVDEYQDTNRAQYELISLLASRYRNICVVGDDAQSIYAFRGADIRNILEFQGDYPDVTVVRLEQNFRSTGTILAAADTLIKQNADQLVKDLWTNNPTGDLITVLACDDDKDEGSKIVSQIFAQSHALKLDLKDFALMYRTNAQSRSLEDALRKNSIPYVIVGGVEFYQRKEVKDVLAYLRVLVNPDDAGSFLRIVNYPTRGVGEAATERLEAFARKREMNLVAAIRHVDEIEGLSKKGAQGMRALSMLLEKYARLKEEISAGELSRALVDELGILRIYKEEGTVESLSRWENVQELLSAISEFLAEREGASLEGFLEDAALVSAVDELEEGRNAVTLMTLHSAKGLEYPVVFITGMEEGLLPFYTGMPERKELEEERRLCYVGITRAMTKLYFSHVRVRYRFGEIAYQSPSRFLAEIPGELLSTVRGFRSSRAGSSQRGGEFARRRATAPGGGGGDDHYFTDEMPDYERGEQEGEKVAVGTLVEHAVFGQGTVLTLAGRGESLKAVIDFASVGRKHLLLKYAKLRIV